MLTSTTVVLLATVSICFTVYRIYSLRRATQQDAGLEATLEADEATRPLQSDHAQQPQSPIAQPLAAVCMLQPSIQPQYEDIDKEHDAPPPRYSDITVCSSRASSESIDCE